MKAKRCTNPSCRREFKPSARCPYCGKEYPRLVSTADRHTRYAVILTSCGSRRIPVIRAIQAHTHLCLLDMKDLIGRTPSLIGKGFQASEARALRAEIRDAGGSAIIMPASHCARYKDVFVLPDAAG